MDEAAKKYVKDFLADNNYLEGLDFCQELFTETPNDSDIWRQCVRN